LTEPPTLFKIDLRKAGGGMMVAMTEKVRKLFFTSLVLALAILLLSTAVSRATDSASSSPQTAVFLPPVPTQNQPAHPATPVPAQTTPIKNASPAAYPVSITSTTAAATISVTAPRASTPVAAAAGPGYTTSPASTATPAAAPASSQARNSVSIPAAPPAPDPVIVPSRAPAPASAATPVAPVATTPAGGSAPKVSPAAFTVTTPNHQDHLNLDVLRQSNLDQLDHHGVFEGQRLYNQTHDLSFLDPANWSVMAYKSRYRLDVYYKGHLYTTYHAVFGRSLASGTKLWEGDRRTPEGAYHIVAKRPSARFRYFLRIDYPNDVDRVRFAEMRDDGEIPSRVREGGEIGIHGTDNPILNVGNVNWTTGCISIDNGDIVELARLLPIGTLVVIKP
jgi:L,D-transpeptidase-like protein